MSKNILLIEDDEHKRTNIIHYLEMTWAGAQISVAASLMSGVRKALAEKPDVILLDMTLPNYDVKDGETGGGMHKFGGVEFLKQMRRRNLDCPVVVITQFETFGEPPNIIGLSELDADLKKQFSPIYRGAIYYHASIDDWIENLNSYLEQIK